MSAATPCVGNSEVYDIVLYDEDVTAEQRAQAVHQAAALCNGCPIAGTCSERVTIDTERRELVLLPEEWLPPVREGRAEPAEAPKRRWSAERLAGAEMAVGRDYVRPAQRPAAWARMAADLAADGQTVPQIAEALCVTVATVEALLRMAAPMGAAA
jgi:hypothetical protein